MLSKIHRLLSHCALIYLFLFCLFPELITCRGGEVSDAEQTKTFFSMKPLHAQKSLLVKADEKQRHRLGRALTVCKFMS